MKYTPAGNRRTVRRVRQEEKGAARQAEKIESSDLLAEAAEQEGQERQERQEQPDISEVQLEAEITASFSEEPGPSYTAQDKLWPEAVDPNEAWTQATIQLGLDAAEAEAAQELIGRKSEVPGYVNGGTARAEESNQPSNRKRHIGIKGAVDGGAIADLEEAGIPRGQATHLINGKRGSRAPRPQ